MTALVVLIIAVALLITVAGVVIAHNRSIRVGDLERQVTDIKQVALKRAELIRELRDQAYDYGYPADPLASIVVGKIREFEKENS